MKVKWLIEADVFQDNTDKLIRVLKNKGYDHHVLKYIPFDDDLAQRCMSIYGPNECVIFYGSLNFGRKLKKNPWYPGVYLNDKMLECSMYYPYLKQLLLHYQDYMMMPYGDLAEHKNTIFKHFHEDKVFIRPNSNMKEFTGMICTKDDFFECVKLAGFYDVDPNLLVLISGVEPLEKEWRFVIVNREPIAGSLYRDWSSPEKITPGTVTRDYVLMNSHSVWEGANDNDGRLAREVAYQAAQRYNPDRCWTVDVAKTTYGIHAVLEIGCFSCAGLYGMNLEKVVDKVSEEALKEWKEYNDPNSSIL
jgi:hypothetical protein